MGINIITSVTYPFFLCRNYVVAFEDAFSTDLKMIIEASGCRDDIASQLKQRLNFLCDYKDKSISLHRKWFESPKQYRSLYSIRIIHHDLNIRILFTFYEYKGTKHAVLLTAFNETKHGTAKTDSYAKYAKIAYDRMNHLEEAFKKWSISS